MVKELVLKANGLCLRHVLEETALPMTNKRVTNKRVMCADVVLGVEETGGSVQDQPPTRHGECPRAKLLRGGAALVK